MLQFPIKASKVLVNIVKIYILKVAVSYHKQVAPIRKLISNVAVTSHNKKRSGEN